LASFGARRDTRQVTGPRSAVEEDGWDERYESLVEADRDGAGREVLCLSATGQIFHETFRERFTTR
jgi:hypothetical protein